MKVFTNILKEVRSIDSITCEQCFYAFLKKWPFKNMYYPYYDDAFKDPSS